jgi:hypothetical protein
MRKSATPDIGSRPRSYIRRFGSISGSGAFTRTEFGRSQLEVPVFGLRRGGGSPRLERFFSEDAERAAGCEMALDVEGVVDGGVNRQEALG